jgi:transposase-like protein
MKRKRHTPAQIARKLREAEAQLAVAQNVSEVCRKLQISEATFHRWRRQYGSNGRSEETERLRALEDENARLKELVIDFALSNQMLKEVAKGD